MDENDDSRAQTQSQPNDYCAGCGLPLKPHPVAGRYRCCADAYWSAYLPETRDHFGHQRMTGLQPLHGISPTWELYRCASTVPRLDGFRLSVEGGRDERGLGRES